MASSSTSGCIQCKISSLSEPLTNGWKSRNGVYVQLCRSCYSLYEAGEFCETFHADKHGWKDCNSCRKRFHCGCIVSLGDYLHDVLGGITCVDCSRTKSVQAST